ncbi:iron dicitrate transport regulator FecR, partial [Bacillus thuringiensis]|nr:iron dicitrate transport regulator FecR [Bacillus thuringiensis]
VMAWRERMLVFNDVPLATVIDEINRYRPGMLLLLDKALGRRRVQARFSLDQLADVATLIRDAYGIEVTRLPGGVVLLG